MQMTPSEFEALADAAFERLTQALEESAADCDWELKSAGVLEIEFADGSRIVVNRHAAAQEIWVASKSGGQHFRWNGSRWIDTRDGSELFTALSGLVGRQSGNQVVLRGQ